MFVNEILKEAKGEKKLNYYQILGCDRTSTTEQILAEYRNRVLRLHPDKLHSNTENSSTDENKPNDEQFCQLLKAKNCLIDVDKRKQYDRWLDSGLTISFETFEQLSANHKCQHTSIHWMKSTNNNLPKAITSAENSSDTDRLVNDNANLNKQLFIDPIDSFRSEPYTKDNVLNMFRNYQI